VDAAVDADGKTDGEVKYVMSGDKMSCLLRT